MSPALFQKITKKSNSHAQTRRNRYKDINDTQKLRKKMEEKLRLRKNKAVSVLLIYSPIAYRLTSRQI